MRVALVHDWLTGMRGGERVLEVFCELFPEAETSTLVHREGSAFCWRALAEGNPQAYRDAHAGAGCRAAGAPGKAA